MKKSLKRILASFLATATVAVGAVGMNASANGSISVNFSPGGTADLTSTPTKVTAYTSCTVTCSTITAAITQTAGGTITGGDNIVSKYNSKSVTCIGTGSGFTSASSNHELTTAVTGVYGSRSLTV